MTITDWLQALWPILVGMVFLVAWFVRIEMKQKELSGKFIEAVKLSAASVTRQEILNEQIREQLACICNSQARMEGVMSVIHNHVNGGKKDAETA